MHTILLGYFWLNLLFLLFFGDRIHNFRSNNRICRTYI